VAPARIASSFWTLFLGAGTAAYAQVPNAGPDQALVFPSTAVLAGSVQGGTPLDYWIADGNGLTENDLIKYDDLTGVTAVGPLRTSGGGTFGFPTDFVRIGPTVYGVDALRRQIYTLDPATGIVAPIGTAWPAMYADVESLAYDPIGDRLFAVDRTTAQLLLIDRSNNTLTPIGTRTLAAYPQIHSLAWRAATGMLYAEDQDSRALLTIDPVMGRPTPVAYLPADPHGRIEELEFVGDRLYGVKAFDAGSSPFAAQLQRISPGYGYTQDVGPVINQVSALALLVNSLPEDRVWSKVSGPGTVTFSDPYALNSTVSFSQPGSYVLKLTVSTNLGPVFDTLIVFEDGSPSPLQLVPVTDFASRGRISGPFHPDNTAYLLANPGPTTLSWQAAALDPWVALSPQSGQLAPGALASLGVSIVDAATSGLPVGSHRSLIQIRNAANGSVLQTRNVDLTTLADPTSGGWTEFRPSADTRVIFVSSSTGNDANNGYSEATPKRTLAAGRALLRDGFPDWLLLKKGDVWDERLDHWNASGRSPTEPMLISSYGTNAARPLLRTGVDSGFSAYQGSHASNLAIVGLHFWANLFTGSQGLPRGVQVYGSVHDLLLEDCHVQAFDTNIVIQATPDLGGRHTHISIRRSVIVDAYTTGTDNAEGVYVSGTDGLLVEENVIDHNGWRDDVPGSTPNWFRHNVYLQNGCTGVVFRGNIVGSTDGVQVRPGGLVEDNLLVQNAIALEFGGGTNPDLQGVTGTVRRNVILDGRNLQPGSQRGWGLWLSNITQSTIESNVIAHNVHGQAPFPLTFDRANGWSGNTRGVENTVFWNNIVYAWNGGSRFTGSLAQTVNVQLIHNRIQNEITLDPLIVHDQASSTGGVFSAINLFDALAAPNVWMQRAGAPLSLPQWMALVSDGSSLAQQVAFPDPSRTIGTYQLMLGGTPTILAFMLEARQQSRSSWRTQYTAGAVNDYIRAGFGF
jgi:hypothetical protein